MNETDNKFVWNWTHFFLYSLVWFFILVIGIHFHLEPVVLSHNSLECLYKSLKIEVELTEEQEQQIERVCGKKPCEQYFGCALNKTRDNPCVEFDQCYEDKKAEIEKYEECYGKQLETMLTIQFLMTVPEEELWKKVRACGDL